MSPQKRIRELKRLGWHAEKTRRGHIRLTHPNSPRALYTASTSSSETGWLNMIAKMRRALRPDAGR
jgi:predicted RNA binding protein YcfA (HicA-like mRNA interferase family)